MIAFRRHIDKSSGGRVWTIINLKRLASFNGGCEHLFEFDLDGLKTGKKLSLLTY